MPQLPGPTGDWQPLGCQFIDVAVSTPLTIPALPVSGGSSRAGINYVGILLAQGAAGQWIREDGQAVVGTNTGGKFLNVGDWQFVYGLPALQAIRVIGAAGGGGTSSLAVTYYWYR